MEDGSPKGPDTVADRAKVVRRGRGAAIVTVGGQTPLAEKVADAVKEITVVNPRFLSGIGEELLAGLPDDRSLVVTIEDGELEGGYGQRIAGFFGDADVKVKNFGFSKAFHANFVPDELLAESGISVEGISRYIEGNLG